MNWSLWLNGYYTIPMTIPRPHNYDNKKYTDKVVDPEMKSILVDKAKNQLSFLINEECHCCKKKKDFYCFWPAYEANDMEELSLWVFPLL